MITIVARTMPLNKANKVNKRIQKSGKHSARKGVVGTAQTNNMKTWDPNNIRADNKVERVKTRNRYQPAKTEDGCLKAVRNRCDGNQIKTKGKK